MTDPAGYAYPFTVRYAEVDQQGVVFNAWYLVYVDEAMAGFLTHLGLPHAAMLADGYDAQLVRTEVDWAGSLRQGDQAEVRVRTAAIGTTSFTLAFEIARDGEVLCRARTVYVCIGTDGSGKRPVPGVLRGALEAGAR